MNSANSSKHCRNPLPHTLPLQHTNELHVLPLLQMELKNLIGRAFVPVQIRLCKGNNTDRTGRVAVLLLCFSFLTPSCGGSAVCFRNRASHLNQTSINSLYIRGIRIFEGVLN